MYRLTHDDPKTNSDVMLNYVFGRDDWGYVRSDGQNESPVLLTDWAKRQCIARGCDDFDADTPQEIDADISDCAFDYPDCPVFLAYTFACQALHLRARLKQYEDICFDAGGHERLSLDRLRELMEAEREGRLFVRVRITGEACGTCGNFERTGETRRGTCKVKPHCVDRRGRVYEGTTFTVSQSHKACKQYFPAETESGLEDMR